MTVRLVILGGSGASTPELADALRAWPGGAGRRPPLEIALVGRSVERLAVVAAEFRRRVGDEGPTVAVDVATERRAALEGADVVLNQVRVGGLAARHFDETFPRDFGLPGEETIGPGGFANALRTVPALRSTWQDVAAIASRALVVNLTNPSGIVSAAASLEYGLPIVSVCDSPVTLCGAIAARLGRGAGEVHRAYAGLNHAGWWVPASAEELAATADLASGQDAGAVAAVAAVGLPYARYYLHPDRALAAQLAAGETRARQLERLQADLLTGYAAGATDLPRRAAAWYGVIVAFLDAWLHGSAEPLLLGLPNQGRLQALPDEVYAEGPVTLPAPGRLEPLPMPRLPPLAATLLTRHAAFEALTVEALRAGSPRLALVRALLANPLVTSHDQAAGLVDAIQAGSPS